MKSVCGILLHSPQGIGICIFLILQVSFPLASGVCPAGCVCANALIVCTCQGALNSDLTLQPFSGIEYISKVYVHSCRSLNIPADTFAGLAIGKELSVSGIQEIRFEPFAFREMQKYPEQITFADSGIHVIPENTFAGLSKAIHLWFRNTTITTINSYAFRDVSRLDYLYFRESTIKNIQAAAFGNMFHISHFFVRGRISISQTGDHLFLNSRIDEIVFEDATIQAMDVFSFAGSSRFETFQVSNCTVETVSFPPHPKFPFKATQSGGKLEFMKTNMEHLSLGAYSNIMEVKFYQCRIQELRESQVPFHNVTLLQFTKTLINYVIDRSMAGTSRIKNIVVDECAIDTIYPDTFIQSHTISYLLFLNTRFIKFEKHAFRGLNLGSLIVDGCDLETIHSGAFQSLNASQTFKIVNSKVRVVEHQAFVQAETGYFGMEHNRIDSLQQHALTGIRAREANISGNYFQQIQESSFSGIHTAYLLLTYNQFSCDCSEKFAPLYGMVREHIRWGFRANLCTNPHNFSVPMEKYRENCPQSQIHLKPVALSQNFVCTEMAFLTKCKCASSTTAWEWISTDTFGGLSSQTSQLWIKDCNAIKFLEKSFSALKNLAVLKVDAKRINFYSDSFASPLNIRVIEFSGAQISDVPRETFTNLAALEFLTFTKCQIRDIQSHSVWGSTIKHYSFRESTINKIHAGFIGGNSKIGEFSVLFSKLGVIEPMALKNQDASVSKITLETNHIVSIEEGAIEAQILKNSLICFASNHVACQCENGGVLELLKSNRCSQAPKRSYCYQPESARNKDALSVLMSTVQLGASNQNLVGINGICQGKILESHNVPSQSKAGGRKILSKGLGSFLLTLTFASIPALS